MKEAQRSLSADKIDISEKTIKVGLVGAGRLEAEDMELLNPEILSNSGSALKIVGGVDNSEEKPGCLGLLTDIKRYSDCQTMFMAHPDIDIVLDFSPNSSAAPEIRRYAPVDTAIISTAKLKKMPPINYSDLLTYQQARAILSTTIDQSEDEILIIDSEGTILDLNQRIIDQENGCKEDFVGHHWIRLRKSMYSEAGRRFSKMVQEIGLPVTETYCDVARDGQFQNYQITVLPMKDPTGIARQLLIVRRNITSRTLMEQQIERSRQSAAISDFSAYVAHEIRNPITAIGGFAKRLWDMPDLPETARDKATVILHESERLFGFVESLYDFCNPADPESGQVNLNEVVQETADLMLPMALKNNIELSLELNNDLPQVFGRHGPIKQSSINLVKNSIESLKNKGKIVIRTRLMDGRVYLEVEDNGPGISPEIEVEVLKPFFSTKTGATGLGLNMARKFIGDFGGHLYIYSKPAILTIVSMELWPFLSDNPPLSNPSGAEVRPN